jgi:ubiquinone/menaquinone biosynthesis C-methylase UbiE
MASAAEGLGKRRGDYGIDAPYVPLMLGGISLGLLTVGVILAIIGSELWAAFVIGGVWMLVTTGSFLYTTRAGKFAVWARLLRELNLRGDEQVLDMGSGRGAVLTMTAKLVPCGKVVGLDLWKSADQSGNTIGAARRNAELEGVADRAELIIGEMTSMPFGANRFDVVVSALAIHNVTDPNGRRTAIDEAWRVLKPGGRLLIADFRSTAEYAGRLRELGARDVAERSLGWRYWYGGPWTATELVTATKPNP